MLKAETFILIIAKKPIEFFSQRKTESQGAVFSKFYVRTFKSMSQQELFTCCKHSAKNILLREYQNFSIFSHGLVIFKDIFFFSWKFFQHQSHTQIHAYNTNNTISVLLFLLINLQLINVYNLLFSSVFNKFDNIYSFLNEWYDILIEIYSGKD